MLKKRKFSIKFSFFGNFNHFFFSSFKIKTLKRAGYWDCNEKFKEEEINKFENVEYEGIDNNGNRFVIGSRYAQFEQEKPEEINMEMIKCIFYFKDQTVLTIIADSGLYNNITNDMRFSDNVKMDYLENTLFSDRAIFNNYENQLLIAGNVHGNSPEANLKADQLDFDLNTKNLKISMYNEERVKIKTKLKWKKALE